MKKFFSQKELTASKMSEELKAAVSDTLCVLDSCYGTDRTDANLGGYVLIIENEGELADLESIFHEPIERVIPEFTDIVSDNYLKTLYILSSDFTVTILFPVKYAPPIVKKGVSL